MEARGQARLDCRQRGPDLQGQAHHGIPDHCYWLSDVFCIQCPAPASPGPFVQKSGARRRPCKTRAE